MNYFNLLYFIWTKQIMFIKASWLLNIFTRFENNENVIRTLNRLFLLTTKNINFLLYLFDHKILFKPGRPCTKRYELYRGYTSN